MTPETIFKRLWDTLFSPEHVGGRAWPGQYEWFVGGRRFFAISFSMQWRFVIVINDHHYGVERDQVSPSSPYTYKWYAPMRGANEPSDDDLMEIMLLV